MGFNAPADIILPASTTVKATVFRQAAWPCWCDRPLTTAGYGVQWTLAGESAASLTYCPILGSHATQYTGNNAASSTLIGVSGNTGWPFSYPLIAASGDSTPWVHIPQGLDGYVVYGCSTPEWTAGTLVYDVALEVWNSPGETSVINIVMNVTSSVRSVIGSLPSATSGGYWIRPVGCKKQSSSPIGSAAVNYCAIFALTTLTAFTPSASTLGAITVGGGRTAHIPLVAAAEFSNSQLPFYATRTTATAALFTNVSQVLNKGGTILCGRISPAVVSPWAVTSAYINNLHPAEKAYLPLETGAYTYVPPSTDMSNFWDYSSNTGSGAPPAPLFRLDNDSLVNVLFFTATSVGEILAVNVDWHLEFRTSSALFPIGMSGMTLESLHQAQLALASVGFFFDNPDHKPILSKVIGAVKRVAPHLVTYASALHPGLGIASKMAKDFLLSGKPRKAMPTTSAASSGMLGRKQKPAPKQAKGKKGKKK